MTSYQFPSVPQTAQHHDLWLKTDKIFREKNINSALAHELVQFFDNCYSSIERHLEALAFLDDYSKLLDRFDAISDENELQKIEEKLTKWLRNIDQIYEDSKDEKLYLEGQRRLFEALFRYNRVLTMAEQKKITQHQIAQNFSAKKETANKVAA